MVILYYIVKQDATIGEKWIKGMWNLSIISYKSMGIYNYIKKKVKKN